MIYRHEQPFANFVAYLHHAKEQFFEEAAESLYYTINFLLTLNNLELPSCKQNMEDDKATWSIVSQYYEKLIYS